MVGHGIADDLAGGQVRPAGEVEPALDGGQVGDVAEQIDVILTRATERREETPDAERLIDHVVAPLMYRILFRPDGLDAAYARRLVTESLGRTG